MAYESKKGKGKAVGVVDSSEDADFLATAKKRMKQAIDDTSENRVFQVEDLKFAAASPDNQWAWPPEVLKLRNPGAGQPPRPTITINKLPQHIRLVTNEQRQNRPAIKVLPVDDKADVEVAEILNGVVRHIEANSDADVAYDTAGESQVVIGEGYWRVLTDYCDEKSFDQDIFISSIKNPFSVYMDPDGLRKDSTGRYCEWAFITDKVHKDAFEKMFPGATNTNWEELGKGDDNMPWMDDDHVVIAEYFCFKDEKKKLVMWADGSVTVGDEMPKVAGLAPAIGPDGNPATRETTIRKVMWSKMTGLEVLETREWAGKYIPVVRAVGNEFEVDGKLVVCGIVRNAKDASRMYNYWVSQEAELLALAPKAPFIAPIEALEGYESQWKTANTVNHPYLPYNAYNEAGETIPPPSRAQPPMPSAGLMEAKLGAGDDIQATVGQYNPSVGAEAKEKSGKAIIARQRQADVGTFHYMDNLARAIRQTGRIVLDLIPKIYDTRRVARILGEDGTPDHVIMDPESPQPYAEVQGESGIEEIYNPSIGQYDVRVTVGPSYTTKRQEAAEFMAQVLQGNKELMGAMGDLYFRMLDVPGAEEIADRLKKTLPPGLAEDEDEEVPVIATPQGPMPAPQATEMMGQMAQQLEQAAEQLKAAGDIQAEAQALEKLRSDVKAEADALEAAKRELALQEDLASERLKNQQLEAEKGLREQAAAAPPAPTEPAEPKAPQQPVMVMDSSMGAPLSEVAQSTMAVAQAIGQQNQLLADMVSASQEAARAAAAPRETELVMGADGMPQKAVSRPMMVQ